MVKAKNTYVYMEDLEAAKDKSGEPHQMWHCGMASLSVREHTFGLLACGA